MTNDKIRVLVADGHALLRQGLKRILESRDAIILEDCVKGEEDSAEPARGHTAQTADRGAGAVRVPATVKFPDGVYFEDPPVDYAKWVADAKRLATGPDLPSQDHSGGVTPRRFGSS